MRFFVMIFLMGLMGANMAFASLSNPNQNRILRAIELPKGSGQLHFELLCLQAERDSRGIYKGVWKNCGYYGAYSKEALNEHMDKVGYDRQSGEELWAELGHLSGRTDQVAVGAVTSAVIAPPLMAVGLLGFLAADFQIGSLKNKMIREMHPFHLLMLTGEDVHYFINFSEFTEYFIESLKAFRKQQDEPRFRMPSLPSQDSTSSSAYSNF